MADVLSKRGHAVDQVDLREQRRPDIAEYDNIVLGTGVRIGMVYRRAKRFLRKNDFEGKRLAIFLSSGIAIDEPDTSRAKFLEPLIEHYGLTPIRYEALPGLEPGPGGELQDRTDPALCRRWAERLAAELELAAAS